MPLGIAIGEAEQRFDSILSSSRPALEVGPKMVQVKKRPRCVHNQLSTLIEGSFEDIFLFPMPAF